MKQGKIYNRIILGAILAVIVIYMGYAVFTALREPLTTTRAIEFEAGEGCQVTGWVVRSEEVLLSPYDITVLDRREGEKVGAGQTVATGYETAGAQERQAEIEEITAQLQQLRSAADYEGSAADLNSLDRDITASLTDCARYVARKDLTSASDLSQELKGLILRRTTGQDNLGDIEAQISQLESQLSTLQSASGADTASIVAGKAGYFSGTVDGYESILTPDRLSSISVAELESLTPYQVPANACGRLIDSNTWYFVAAVPSDRLEDVLVGDQVQVSFAHDLYDTLTMTVERIGDEENGERILVLRSSEYIQEVTLLREQSADVVFRVYSGLRVPKDALRVNDEGQDGVYVLESAEARWKPVTILYDNGESYVVELDKSKVSNLWPGDEIIVNAKNLYDGKVVITS